MKKMSKKPALLCALTVVVVALSCPFHKAAAQDFNARLRQLENQVQTLSRAVFRGEMPSAENMPAIGAGSGADIEVRMTQLETMLRQLTGQIEKQGFEVRKMREQLDRALRDYEARLTALESGVAQGGAGVSPSAQGSWGRRVAPVSSYNQQGTTTVVSSGPSQMNARPSVEVVPATGGGYSSGGAVVQQATPQQGDIRSSIDPLNLNDRAPSSQTLGQLHVTPDGTPRGTAYAHPQHAATTAAMATASSVEAGRSPIPDAIASSPEGLYEYAFTKLRQTDYGGAQDGFKLFLEKYADHPLSSNAKYWLAETYYVRDEFGMAAKLFAEGYQQHPTSSKAPDNLLKLAMSLANLNKRDDACVTLQQLESQFGSGTGPVIQKAHAEIERLGCR